MKKKFVKGLLATSGALLVLGGALLAINGDQEVSDVTPPWGRILIEGAQEVNSVNYVKSTEVTVNVEVGDDTCLDTEIYYHVSLDPISTTTQITEWTQYSETTKSVVIELPNTTNTHTIYAAFKDKYDNVSVIYTDGYTITYDANGGVDAPAEQKVVYGIGAAYLRNNKPSKDGKYFAGWSTKENPTTEDVEYVQGERISSSEMFKNGNVTLYAVWSDTVTGLPTLASRVKIGDYVNYPVYYDNVASYNGSYTSTLKGWRVIGIEDDGTVNLVSAGVPLTYYHTGTNTTSVTNLTTNFTTLGFTSSGLGFRKTGMNPYKTNKEIFTNIYTKMDENDSPVVRAMKQEDITGATGLEWASGTTMGLSNAKWNGLFSVGAYYYLASAYPSDSDSLWYVGSDGYVGYNSGSSYFSERGVRPVVSLKSTVKTTGTDTFGAWEIEI